MWTVIAIALAVIDSICFAAAAVYQQRAVRRTVSDGFSGSNGTDDLSDLHPRHHRLSLRGLLALPKQPGWLGGVGLMLLGSCLHAVALVIAPVSVIQPIGILGVPIAVLLAAKLAGQRPSKATAVPILLCVVSVGAFVAVAAKQVSTADDVPIGALLIAEAVLLAVIGIAFGITRRIEGWRRCLISAIAGALGVGMVAALMRAIAQNVQAGANGVDLGRLVDPVTLAMVGLLILNAVVGGAMVQQAYASGPAEVVLASLTVVDPMIAVLIGLVLLGEGAALPGPAMIGMIICAAASVAGVIVLARTHPEVAARRAGRDVAPALTGTATTSDSSYDRPMNSSTMRPDHSGRVETLVKGRP
ncbi:DMT family protein [Microlunatus soli]|nr:hypothetical protein [Microlunatus soli]